MTLNLDMNPKVLGQLNSAQLLSATSQTVSEMITEPKKMISNPYREKDAVDTELVSDLANLQSTDSKQMVMLAQ